MDSEAFVKMIFLKKKNKVLELRNLGILVLLNKEIIYVTQKFYFHYKFWVTEYYVWRQNLN